MSCVCVYRLLQKNLSEWLALLEGQELPFGPVNDIEQVFEDPQVPVHVHVEHHQSPPCVRVCMHA